MIPVQEALKQILETIPVLALERVGILNALGRVAGEDIRAGRDIPPRDNSAMDGYALRWEDTIGAVPENPAILDIIEDIPAGHIPQRIVGTKQASRIMTGAPIPQGADAVVRVEDTEADGRQVKIFCEVRSNQDIRFTGEDVRHGELVIARGAVIRPAEIGMLASLGRSFIRVHQRPVVAVIATGDELVDIDQTPSPWQIISSNSYATAAQVKEAGGIHLLLGIAKDTRDALMGKFNDAGRADIVITSGGVSMGDYDLVKVVMSEVGNAMQFWQVAMRPGRPLMFGNLKGIPMFGLPGNPVSSMVSFEQFVRPAILKMSGHRKIFRKMIRARIMEDYNKKAGIVNFVRGHVTGMDGSWQVTMTGEQGSGILMSMVKANGLIVLPEEIVSVKEGDEVAVQLLEDANEGSEKPDYLKRI